MALTVGEALAVNTLLSWLLQRGVGEHNRVPGAAAATEAARLLAGHADKRLMAGIRADEITRLDVAVMRLVDVDEPRPPLRPGDVERVRRS